MKKKNKNKKRAKNKKQSIYLHKLKPEYREHLISSLLHEIDIKPNCYYNLINVGEDNCPNDETIKEKDCYLCPIEFKVKIIKSDIRKFGIKSPDWCHYKDVLHTNLYCPPLIDGLIKREKDCKSCGYYKLLSKRLPFTKEKIKE